MTAGATVDGSRGLFTIGAAEDHARATLSAAVIADTDLVVDYAMNLPPAGTTWVRRTSFRVGADRYFHDLNFRDSPGDITWQLFRQTGAATPVAIGAVQSTGFGATPNEIVRVQVQAEGTAPTTLRARVWRPTLDSIPTFLEETDASGPQTAGSVGTAVEPAEGTPTNLPVTHYTDNFVGMNLLANPPAEFDGSAAARATATAILTVPVNLSGAANVRSGGQSTLTLGGAALGALAAVRSTATAQLTNPGVPLPPLVGVVAARATATAQLTIPVPEPPVLPPGGAIMSISNYLENALLNHVFGRVIYTPPTSVWIQLTSTVPADDGSGPALLGRAQVPNNTASWPAAASGIKSSGLAISFGSTTGQNTLPNAVGFQVWDAQTGGNMLWWGTLVIPYSVSDRRVVSMPPSAMRLALD